MISYVLDSIGASKALVIHNKLLLNFGFKEYLINTYRSVTFDFIELPFQTRGPAESLYVGLKSVEYEGQVVVLDNDNVYEGMNLSQLPPGNFVIYNDNPTGLTHYSFVQLMGPTVSSIAERNPISCHICMGGYGFQSVDVCRQYCKMVIMEDALTESYLSKVIQRMILDGHIINSHYLPLSFSLGTEKDIILNMSRLKKPKLRVVFDLDNTLVTYPTVAKDYSTVKVIPHIARLVQYLRKAGHYIIIHTARNMVSSEHNVGRVLKSVGLSTLESLQNLGIEYDEIIFGKPYGDLYIDDKSFNTFDFRVFKQMGFFDIPDSLQPPFRSNRYNRVIRVDKRIINKQGPNLAGEIFFYKAVADSVVSHMFPSLLSHDSDESIFLSFINGSSLQKLYVEGLLQEDLIRKLLDTVIELHRAPLNDGVTISENDIHMHYIKKFEERSKVADDYPFDDFHAVYTAVKSAIHAFLDLRRPVDLIIHGDLWFSNIMYLRSQFKFFDMRGKFNEKLTIKGHRIYDWSKLYQSIVGLDAVIEYGEMIAPATRGRAETIFWDHLLMRGAITKDDIPFIKRMTGYLVYNTFHAYDVDFPPTRKAMVWSLVKECIGV